MLQRICQSIIAGVSALPPTVTFRKFLWGKGSQAQQVVGTVLDHVDAQIVSSVDTKVWTTLVAKSKPLEFEQSIQGRMLYSFEFGNVHQSTHSFFSKDFAVRCEHQS